MRLAAVLLYGLIFGSQALNAQDIRTLVELARTAPPELTTDTILKLVEDGSIPPGEQRNDLLEEAFKTAARAQDPVHLAPVPGLPPDTRAVFRAQGSELQLDTLSLRNRAFRLVLKIDPEVARRWFDSIQLPAFEPAPCEDAFIADASAYYDMAGALAQSMPQPAEFLEKVLEGARSPAELAAFAQMLATVSLNSDQRDSLLNALAVKMENVAADYRSFTATVSMLRAAVEEHKSPALAVGFRRFLTKQMSAPRCDEDFGDATPTVNWFNSDFHGDLPVIADEEVEPARRLGGVKSETYFTTADAKHVWDGFDQLKTTIGATDWRPQLLDYLRDLSNWAPTAPAIDIFHQKMTVLSGLFEVIPPGPDRDQVMGQSIAVLQYSGVETHNAAEWLIQVKSLVAKAGEDLAKLKQGFRESGDAGLALFVALAS